jgi:hypothetical protein
VGIADFRKRSTCPVNDRIAPIDSRNKFHSPPLQALLIDGERIEGRYAGAAVVSDVESNDVTTEARDDCGNPIAPARQSLRD